MKIGKVADNNNWADRHRMDNFKRQSTLLFVTGLKDRPVPIK